MELSDVVRILKYFKRHPFTRDISQVRIPNPDSLPEVMLRFRGSTMGEVLSSVEGATYIGSDRGTFCSPRLHYTIDMAIQRSTPVPNGEWGHDFNGRFDPVTYEQMDGYGIPCIMAIDMTEYTEHVLPTGCLANSAVKIPIDPKDVVILVTHDVDHLQEIIPTEILSNYPLYGPLVQRIAVATEQAPFDESGLNQYQRAFLERAFPDIDARIYLT